MPKSKRDKKSKLLMGLYSSGSCNLLLVNDCVIAAVI